jgi:hypothetical protein
MIAILFLVFGLGCGGGRDHSHWRWWRRRRWWRWRKYRSRDSSWKLRHNAYCNQWSNYSYHHFQLDRAVGFAAIALAVVRQRSLVRCLTNEWHRSAFLSLIS